MMIDELAIGVAVCLVVTLVHLIATFILVDFVDPYENRLTSYPRARLMIALSVASIVLLAAHLLEVGVWAIVYDWNGLVQHRGDAYYSAFVNFTALGYGDSLQGTTTRLLGPMAAASGVLMFGWSTALMFQVLQRHLPNIRQRKTPHA
jgi:hypothetical protein